MFRMEPTILAEDLDHSSLELILPVQTSHPDGQYSILVESNGEFVSPSALNYLCDDYIHPSESKADVHSSLVPYSSNDNKTFETQTYDMYSNVHPSYEETLVMDNQNGPTYNKPSVNGNAIDERILPKIFDEQSASSHEALSCDNGIYQSMGPTINTKHTESFNLKPEYHFDQHYSSLDGLDSFLFQPQLTQDTDPVVHKYKHGKFFETNFNPTLTDQIPLSDKSNDSFISPFILKDKNTPKKFCPQCKSKYSEDRELKYFQVSLDSFILLCSTDKCTYPYDTPNGILNIQTYPADEVMQSEIDFDINNIPLNTDSINEQLLKQHNDIIQPFLNSFNLLKQNFEKLKDGDYKISMNDHDVCENNEPLRNVINEALASNVDNIHSQSVNLKEESTFEAKREVDEDIDNYLEEQNRELARMMLHDFV